MKILRWILVLIGSMTIVILLQDHIVKIFGGVMSFWGVIKIILHIIDRYERKSKEKYCNQCNIEIDKIGISVDFNNELQWLINYCLSIDSKAYNFQLAGVVKIGNEFSPFSHEERKFDNKSRGIESAWYGHQLTSFTIDTLKNFKEAINTKNIQVFIFYIYKNQSSGYHLREIVFSLTQNYPKSDNLELIMEKCIPNYTAEYNNPKWSMKNFDNGIPYGIKLNSEGKGDNIKDQVSERKAKTFMKMLKKYIDKSQYTKIENMLR